MADMRLDSIGKGQIWASRSDGGHVRMKRIELSDNKPAKVIYEMIPTNRTYVIADYFTYRVILRSPQLPIGASEGNVVNASAQEA